MLKWIRLFIAPLAAVALAACDGTGPSGTAPLSVSFFVGSGAGSPALMSVTLTDEQGNSLEITSAELVLREIEFERTEAVADCDAPESADDCEEIEAGPFLAALPVDATTPVVALEAAMPVGSFDEVEFDVHKLDDADPRDAGIISQRPEFDQISILVRGNWTPAGGSTVPFEFSSSVNEEMELEFAVPMVVVEGEPKNVTFAVDLDSWFRDASGTLLNPETANHNQPNENLVIQNIRVSIEGFEDDDQDGVED